MIAVRRPVIILVAVFLILNVVLHYIHYAADEYEWQPLREIAAWKFDYDSKFFVVDSKWALQNKYTQFISKNAEDAPISVDEVKKVLADKISSDNGPKFREIEKEVHENYTEEFKKVVLSDIRALMSRDYAALFFANLVTSYGALDELRAQYLLENDEKIKNGIVYDLLKDTTDTALKEKIEGLDRLLVDRSKYFRSIIRNVILRDEPRLSPLKHNGEGIGGNLLPELGRYYSKKFLTDDRVRLTSDEFTELQDRHDSVVRSIRQFPLPPKEVYTGEGIVITSTRLNLPAALGVVIQLRDLKSELPIEVVVNSEEDYDRQLCEEILPKFQAKCLVIERVLTLEFFKTLTIEGFQMKLLGILVSSFDQTIFLDSDNWPVKNPDFLFTSKPYMETRYLMWPDAWHKGVSPLYYDIARFEVGPPVRRAGLPNDRLMLEYLSKNPDEGVFFHDLDGLPSFRGVESGQMVMSKREHYRSLILATYYNFFGPGFYYHLLYQGTYGVGDRETFVPALHVMNEPYYLCDYELRFLGLTRDHTVGEGQYFDESTMVQRDPQQAQEYQKLWQLWLKSEKLDPRLYMFQEGDYTNKLRDRFHKAVDKAQIPDPLFLHVHDPKLNALYNEKSHKTQFDYEGRYLRKIGDFDDIVGDFDYELRFQTINMWVTCHGMTDDTIWQAYNVNREETCKKMQHLITKLKEDSNNVEAGTVELLEKMGQSS